MADSIEVSFVLTGDRGEPQLEAIRERVDNKQEYRADWGRDDEYVYAAREIEEDVFGVHLFEHSPDSDWYTLPTRQAIELEISTHDLTLGEDVETRVSTVLKFVQTVYAATVECRYAFGLDTEHVGGIGEDWGPDKPVTDESLAENRINEVSWLTLFGPELVVEYGREWLLSAPAWKREELDDGAILLVASPDPTDYEQFSEDRDILRTYFSRRGN
ncbi:hypothetical protein C475_08656 [Halosimplex carlsbadense 2-9-1]|uniref:Uncharacterized protein n=1 Tax=Halosimplex carlsbadense 2-9-1 TaxID=797114 RepID=M0CX46_9EURY|nr:hypothetical protein [Halosimplex carlsbadense]ELZ26992.1 hypothetical protein C475_08656 [Halosimplex carlsbadense 2-9-1]